MKPAISFSDLEKNNFEFRGHSNSPIRDKCTVCGNIFEYASLKKFLKYRILLPINERCLCQICFLSSRTSKNPEWIEKNRKSQLISQNKPEQKLKNALAVSKSWTKERRKKASESLTNKWNNDPVFAKKIRNNLKKYSGSPKNTKEGFGTGGLKGIYKNIIYDSALELSYILWCIDKGIDIKRYDKDPIIYVYENKNRLYFPDFIINNLSIVEIKGKGLYFKKNYKRNKAKHKAAKKILGPNFIVIFDNNKILKENYKKARKLHHEIKK